MIDTVDNAEVGDEGIGEILTSTTSTSSTSATSLTSLLLYNHVTGLLLLVALSMVVWDRWLNSTRDKSCPLPLPPGFMGLPFAGNTPFIIFEPLIGNIFDFCMKLFGGAYKLHVAGQPTVRVVEPEHCYKVLNGADVEPTWPYPVRTLLGAGATSQISGAAHKAHRRVTLRAFTPAALRGYAGPMQRGCRRQLHDWMAREGTVNVFMESKVLAFKVAWDLLVGLSVEGEKADELTRSFMDFVGGFISVPINLPGTKFYKACRAKEVIHAYIAQAIAVVKAGGGANGGGANGGGANGSRVSAGTALHLILDNADGGEMADMDDDAVKDLVTELLFAGHETISSVFTAATMHLHNHPEYLAKLRACLDRAGLLDGGRGGDDLGGDDLGGDDLTYDRLLTGTGGGGSGRGEESECAYVEAVFLEVLRYTPPIQGVFRTVTRTMEVDQYQVPRGWSVMAGILETHRHNPFYQHPASFNPDRWAQIRSRPELRKNFLPFGSGAHTCLGKEYGRLFGMVFITELARMCDWSIGNPEPPCTFIPSFRPRDGLPTRFFPRWDSGAKKQK